MPEQTPRLSAAKPGMEVWEIGVAAQPDFAASAYARVLLDHLGGRPVDADLAQGPRVIALDTQLAVRGVPVLHDISSGGLATAIAEVAIASGAGAELIDLDWRRWMTESPHRFVAVVPAGYDLGAGDVAASRVGTIGADHIDFGRHGSIPLSLAATTWREAIPRRMH
jgi:phosphoribosylformylglycinamidine synthase